MDEVKSSEEKKTESEILSNLRALLSVERTKEEPLTISDVKMNLRKIRTELEELKKERAQWTSLLRDPKRVFDPDAYRMEIEAFELNFRKIEDVIQSNEDSYSKLITSLDRSTDELIQGQIEDLREVLFDELKYNRDSWLDFLYSVSMIINCTFRGYFGLDYYNRCGFFVNREMSRTIHSYAYPSYVKEYDHSYPMRWVLLLDEFTRFVESLPLSVLQRIWSKLQLKNKSDENSEDDDAAIITMDTEKHSLTMIRFLFELFAMKCQQKKTIGFRFKPMETIHLVWDLNHNLKKYLKDSNKLTKVEFEENIGGLFKQVMLDFHEGPKKFVNSPEL